MADNTGQTTADLRMRKLNITAPASLATHFVQAGLFDQAMNLHNLCGEGGDGSFNWLLRFDTVKQTLVTGGAPPATDPFGIGYCFMNAFLSQFEVFPVTMDLVPTAGGLASASSKDLYMPVYFHGDPNNMIVLPILSAQFNGMTLSAGGNCIGSYNADGVASPTADGTCQDQDPSSCQRWHTSGSVSGFIQLGEANGVMVQDLGKSLCVLLTNGIATANGGMTCAVDGCGRIVAQGDSCSVTQTPGGCADSFWFSATFAASAAKIDDASTDPACHGG